MSSYTPLINFPNILLTGEFDVIEPFEEGREEELVIMEPRVSQAAAATDIRSRFPNTSTYRLNINCRGYKAEQIKLQILDTKLVITGRDEQVLNENFTKKEFRKVFNLKIQKEWVFVFFKTLKILITLI